MCGIAGFFDRKSSKEEKLKTVKGMAEKIRHRGPDGEGYFADENVALAHKRLSIMDIEGGAQPMYSNDRRYVVVFNGEIYNFKELKEELSGYSFSNNCDTEVLLAGYEKWGEDITEHLRGMFAFALYDTLKGSLFIARDHFGIKPLYIYEKDDVIMFASEIKAFMAHPLFEASLDESLLSCYMTFSFTPTTKTFFSGVKRLDAGHSLLIEDGSIKEKTYFELSYTLGEGVKGDEIQKIDDCMKDSVSHHMIADVEVGSFLSGGVDSSYLVALAKPAKTFTVGYADKRYSEIDNAGELAEKLGIENYSKLITPEEYIAAIDDAIYHMDEPSSDPAIISLYFVAKEAAKQVKVVLSGEGSDEFFGGYNTYHTLTEYGAYDKIPFPVRNAIARALRGAKPFRGRNFLVRRGLRLEDYYVGISRVFEDSEIRKLSKIPISLTSKEVTSPIFGETLKAIRYSENKELSKELLEKSKELVMMQALDIRCWLVKDILQKADRMTMAHSLEGRVPFTDKEVFKLASKLPFECKVTKDKTKAALREAAKNSIPNDSYARKKLGFPVPVREWMKEGRLYEEVKSTLSSETAERFFNTDMLMNMLEEHRLGKKDRYRKLWNVFIFVRWYNIFMKK